MRASHAALDSVLRFEKIVSQQFPAAEKYSYEQRGSTLTKVYARKFCQAYHDKLNGMVERRLRAAILMISSVWYTAWVDAGQPDLSQVSLVPLTTNQNVDVDSLAQGLNRWKQRSCH